jgi:hypothetical protein
VKLAKAAHDDYEAFCATAQESGFVTYEVTVIASGGLAVLFSTIPCRVRHPSAKLAG